MTSAVYRNTPSLSVPQTQNTALVLEFNCLYTHDVRKKQKKWHDGLLRYHTFNKRVMVYDVPRNFIGDMHWTGDEQIQEGAELTLERCGVKVEVADCIGQTETDLTELRKSKNKDSSAETSSSPARAAPIPRPRPAPSSISRPRSNTQLKHRSLNALLGTPKGPIGKAVLPAQSPFEERHQNEEHEEWEDGRPPKRAKTAASPEWSVIRTSKASNPVKQKETPMWACTSDSTKLKKNASLPHGQQKLGIKEVIELSDNVEQPNPFLPGLSNELLAPSSPAKRIATTEKPAVRSSSPIIQPQNAAPAPKRNALVPQQAIDVDASAERRLDDEARSSAHSPRKTVRQQQEPIPAPKSPRSRQKPSRKSPLPQPQRPTSTKRGQTLRLAATAPKKRSLQCEDQLTKKAKRLSSTNTDDAADTLLDSADSGEVEKRPMSAREKLEARLAKIDKKSGSASISRLKPAPPKPPPRQMETIDITSEETITGSDAADEPLIDDHEDVARPQTSHEASAIELAKPDQLMLPPAAPPAQRPKIVPLKHPSPKPASPKEVSPQPPPCKENRSFRRVGSESGTVQAASPSRRIPGAPMRCTPSPTKRSRESTAVPNRRNREPTPAGEKQIAASANTNRQKKPLQKSVSLNVTLNGTSAVMLSRPFQAPGKADRPKEPEIPKDLGPWSRDAFDLFSWRPPGWDEDGWCTKQSTDAAA